MQVPVVHCFSFSKPFGCSFFFLQPFLLLLFFFVLAAFLVTDFLLCSFHAIFISLYSETCVVGTDQMCPDYQGFLIFQVSLHIKGYFRTITKCPDYAGVLHCCIG